LEQVQRPHWWSKARAVSSSVYDMIMSLPLFPLTLSKVHASENEN
jgi:hypothetical protein